MNANLMTKKIEMAKNEAKAAGYLEVREWFLSTFPEIKQTRDDHKKKVQAILDKAA